MQMWELLDFGPVPDSRSVMELYRRGPELAIRVDGRELMSNRLHGSEDALAELAFDRLGPRAGVRVLIGGLGMGFTLAAARARLAPDGLVVVAELVPAVLKWNRGPLADVAGRPLEDPRVSVFEGDVGTAIREAPARWDAILLDVDNGPKGLTHVGNDWLYGWDGLDAIGWALRPGGWLGVWSAAPDVGFTRRLRRVGYRVEELSVRARGQKGGRRHTLWMATHA